MPILRIAGCRKHSSVNGPGIRFVLFTQGCPHHCPGCHNPETWDPEDGAEISDEALLADITGTKYLDGITISGGEPLLQAGALLPLAEAVAGTGLTIWMYTGYTFEQVMAGDAGADAVKLLQYTDVLVDGRYIASRKEDAGIWRGSSNQRLIDVPESLRSGCAVTLSGMEKAVSL